MAGVCDGVDAKLSELLCICFLRPFLAGLFDVDFVDATDDDDVDGERCLADGVVGAADNEEEDVGGDAVECVAAGITMTDGCC